MLVLARGGIMHVCIHSVRSLLVTRGYMHAVDSTNIVTLYRVIMQFLFSFLI